MLRSLDEIIGHHIQAMDREFGRVNDFLFDDAAWTVRYLVADTGNWLPGRLVLIAPSVIGEADWPSGRGRDLPGG